MLKNLFFHSLFLSVLICFSGCNTVTKTNAKEIKLLKDVIVDDYFSTIVEKENNSMNEKEKYDVLDVLMKCDDVYLLRFSYDGFGISELSGLQTILMGSYYWFEMPFSGEKFGRTYAWKDGNIYEITKAYEIGWLTEKYLRWHEEFTIVVSGYPNKNMPNEPLIDKRLSQDIIDAYSKPVWDELNQPY